MLSTKNNVAVGKHTSVDSSFVPDPRYQDLPIADKDEGFKLIKQHYDQTHFVNHQIDTYTASCIREAIAISVVRCGTLATKKKKFEDRLNVLK